MSCKTSSNTAWTVLGTPLLMGEKGERLVIAGMASADRIYDTLRSMKELSFSRFPNLNEGWRTAKLGSEHVVDTMIRPWRYLLIWSAFTRLKGHSWRRESAIREVLTGVLTVFAHHRFANQSDGGRIIPSSLFAHLANQYFGINEQSVTNKSFRNTRLFCWYINL